MTSAQVRTPMRFDVSDVVGEPASLAATYYPARNRSAAPAVLVCLPGGTYSREYWDFHVAGHSGYSFADFATENGYAVLTIDPLGTGESSKPARNFGFSDIAAALACAVAALPTATGNHAPPVAVAHSLGGYLAITQQALFPGYAALAILGCTNQHVAQLNLDPALIARAATADGRATLAQEILSALPEPFFEGPREHLQSWFHLGDVPADVVQADAVTAKSVVPRIFGTAMVPGVVAEHAALIDVPVLLGYGAVDVSPNPRAEAGLYCGSPDIAGAPTSPRSCWPIARTATTWHRAGAGSGSDCSIGPKSSSRQWVPDRFNVITPTTISPMPTTFATEIGEPRNSTAISTMAAVPIADHNA